MTARGDRLRVAFLIRSLDVGGAERQLCALARSLDKAQFDVTILTMYAGGGLWRDLADVPGVRLISLDKRGRWDLVGFGRRLLGQLRVIRPNIVHGYMGGANELALVFGRLVGARVVWGIRVSDLDPAHYVWSVGTLFHLGARLSRRVDLIIANSEVGRVFHQQHGYDAQRMVVIPNGIDAVHFRPDSAAGRHWRKEHGFPASALIVGYPARLDPMKDHPTFLRAAARLVAQGVDATFVCAGNGPATYQAELSALAGRLGLADRVRWIPANPDPRPFYNGVDLVTTASAFGEGFPNVVGEAMACGTPCVATSVGDAARVIGAFGSIVAPGDHEGLAGHWGELLTLPAGERASLGLRARGWITAEFSPALLADRTAKAFQSLFRS